MSTYSFLIFPFLIICSLMVGSPFLLLSEPCGSKSCMLDDTLSLKEHPLWISCLSWAVAS